MRMVGCVVAICGVFVGQGRALGDEPAVATEVAVTDAAVLESVARSLPFLELAGVDWMAQRQCVSCHHVPFLLWSHRAAATKGVTTDGRKLAEWDEWARRDSLSRRNSLKLTQYELKKLDATVLPDAVREKLKPVFDQGFVTTDLFVARLKEVLTAEELQAHQEQLIKNATLAPHSPERTGGGVDVLGNLLLSELSSTDHAAIAEFRASTLELMKQGQLPNGAWVPGSQFASMRRWSTAAADQTTTMWTVLALVESNKRNDPKPIERAIAYLKEQPDQSDNQEWLAVRLLFGSRFDGVDQSASWRQKLLDVRGTDGGWSWQKGNPSDPYTTGLVLYVLSKTDVAAPEVVRDARRFLLSQQQPDGSWRTESKYITKATDPERLKGRDEIYHYWGTAWAVLGLLETMPDATTSTP